MTRRLRRDRSERRVLNSKQARKRIEDARKREEQTNNVIHRRKRWRYFQSADGWQFCWSTTPTTYLTKEGETKQVDKPWTSWVMKPIGPGSRSGKAKQWEEVKDLRSRHRYRKDAKQAALHALAKHRRERKL